jgi:hypothetical protein
VSSLTDLARCTLELYKLKGDGCYLDNADPDTLREMTRLAVADAVRGDSAPLELMDVGVSAAPRLAATVRLGDQQAAFALPVWRGDDGSVRIGLPLPHPTHGADMGQLITTPEDLLETLAKAMRHGT